MENSILNDIKFLIGILDDDSYDEVIIMNINAILLLLRQKGIGPEEGFSIYDSSSKWSDFINDLRTLGLIKSYIHLKVKLIFDPPANSIIAESIKANISEIEWHLTNQV